MSAPEPQDGNESIDEIGKTPNLDLFFDRNPKHLTDDQLLELIKVERQQRALFIEKKGK